MAATIKLALATLAVALPLAAQAQSETNLRALRGLVPIVALAGTPAGRAALDANMRVTSGIQTGAIRQPFLMPFAEQQQHAIRDAFITDGNATQLADALGTTLGGVYGEKARYSDPHTFTSIGPAVEKLVGYTNDVTKSDSNSGKFFFANRTVDGTKPVSDRAVEILSDVKGEVDTFGRAYGRPAGSPGADKFGNSRPFQTASNLLAYRGTTYFGAATHTIDWLRGPRQNLTDSPSYPSGHTTYGYTESMLLALLVPERYSQMVARAAEYGNNRIVIGAHYAMDVLGGRSLSLHALAHLLANDPAYVGRPRENPAIENAMGQNTSAPVQVTDYPALLKAARSELKAFLEERCGSAIATCAAKDESRFRDTAAVAAMYDSTLTYALPVVHESAASRKADVAKDAPEAGYLITAAFPKVTLAEAHAILTQTLALGGGFLDSGSEFGIYSRLNLYAAGGKAAALEASRR